MSDKNSQRVRREVRSIAVAPDKTVTSVWCVPEGYATTRAAIVLAHGAGNDMTNPFLGHVHEHLGQRGWLSVKFNFPYKELGRKAPDRPPVLEATWHSVIATLRHDPALAPKSVILCGKSMGGRIASHIAASGEACDGLIFLGYPLHPARQPDRLRSEHLAQITQPMLFIEGSRDPLCDLSLLRRELKGVRADVRVHVIEDGDHSFKVPKRSGRTEQEVWSEIVDVCDRWLRQTITR